MAVSLREKLGNAQGSFAFNRDATKRGLITIHYLHLSTNYTNANVEIAFPAVRRNDPGLFR